MIFYPNEDDLESGTMAQKLELLLEAAMRYRAVVLDMAANTAEASFDKAQSKPKKIVPRDTEHAFNWQEIARLLRELRELPEGSPSARTTKANYLKKLAEVYEILRAAKMPKLEAVRLALMSEVSQLSSSR